VWSDASVWDSDESAAPVISFAASTGVELCNVTIERNLSDSDKTILVSDVERVLRELLGQWIFIYDIADMLLVNKHGQFVF
jgi:hypothetical protein